MNNKKGFSIIEVLIGLIILAVGLLVIAGMQITSIKGNYFSQNVTQATTFAQEKLEDLKKLSYEHADLSSGEHSEGNLSGTIFSRKFIVTDITSTMKMIKVIVQWTDITVHGISLSTIRAK